MGPPPFSTMFGAWQHGHPFGPPTGSEVFRTQCFTAGPAEAEGTALPALRLREVSPGSTEDAVKLLETHHRKLRGFEWDEFKHVVGQFLEQPPNDE